MTRFPVTIEQYERELHLRDKEIKLLKGKLAVHENGVPEVLQGAFNEVRLQAARECAEIAEGFFSCIGGSNVAQAIKEKFGL